MIACEEAVEAEPPAEEDRAGHEDVVGLDGSLWVGCPECGRYTQIGAQQSTAECVGEDCIAQVVRALLSLL